jgi:hypothetical protein
MQKTLWKVHGTALGLSNSATQYQYADPGEVLEEVMQPGTTNSPDDVRVFRTKEATTISYIVSRAELEANASLVS